MKRLILAGLVVTCSVQAEPNQYTGVDCDQIAKSSFEIYRDHTSEKVDEQIFMKSLETFCTMGNGSYISGKNLNDTVDTVSGVLTFHSSSYEQSAALVSSAVSGFLYGVAHGMKDKNK